METHLPIPDGLSDGQICLRPFRVSDAASVFAACQDPLVRRFTTFPEPGHERDSQAWIESHPWLREHGVELDLAIADAVADGGPVLGSVGIVGISFNHRRAQLGYWVQPAARRRGVASGAVRLLSGWAISGPLRLERLELHIDVENVASRRTAERAGFRFEAALRSYMQAKSRRWDVAMYALLAAPAPQPTRSLAARSSAGRRAVATRLRGRR